MIVRGLLALAVVSSTAAAQSPDTTADRPADRAYTEAQAARGDTAYQWYCASCHTEDFHRDAKFRADWFGRSAWELFRSIRTNMPDDNPGGLSDADYIRVLAYIFKLNGFTPGADSLAPDSLLLQRIRIVRDTGALAHASPPGAQPKP